MKLGREIKYKNEIWQLCAEGFDPKIGLSYYFVSGEKRIKFDEKEFTELKQEKKIMFITKKKD